MLGRIVCYKQRFRWYWATLAVIALTLLSPTYQKDHDGSEVRRLETLLVPTYNTLSYVFIAGVEGVGHHAVSPAIAAIAKTCGKHVLYEMKLLRKDQRHRNSMNVKERLASYRIIPYPTQDVVILDDWSFPTDGFCRNCSLQEIEATRYYDLEWLHRTLMDSEPTMRLRYLYLNRDFYRTVASHPEFDGSFQHHARVLHEYIQYLYSEYKYVTMKQPDSWRQISYEWFANMDSHNCTAIVSALIEFLQWGQCDIANACSVVHEMVHKQRVKPIIPEDFAYAQTFNVTSPIPVLDISSNRTYDFTAPALHRAPVYKEPKRAVPRKHHREDRLKWHLQPPRPTP